MFKGVYFKDRYRHSFKYEYLDLCDKIKKVETLIEEYHNNTLNFEPKCDCSVLQEQLVHMVQYKKLLEKRANIEEVDL